MLSIQVLKSSASGAFKYYFQQEDLPFEMETLGEWFGRGAEALGLPKAVDEATFTALYKGTLPNGQQLGKRTRDGIVHRPGVDLTFSSPKSFSIALALTQDKRLVAARNKALAVALNAIEKDCAMARRSKNSELYYEKTDNLIFATAPHITSRALDPQDHVHCLLMNITQCNDGVFRALASEKGKVDESSYGVIEQIMARKKHYGLVFRVQLAAELVRLGFEIDRHEQGFYEINGISQLLINHFSKRRIKQILPALANSPYQGGKAAAIATLNTRETKANLSWLSLLKRWEKEVKEIECEQEIKQIVDTLDGKPKEVVVIEHSAKAQRAMAFALASLEAKKSVFSEYELLNTALGHLPVGCSVAQLMQARDDLILKGKLIALEKSRQYTTSTIKNAEQNILYNLKSNTELKCDLLKTNKSMDSVLKKSPQLSAPQNAALQAISQSKHQWLALTGGAGCGKRTISGIAAQIAHKQGYQVTVLTPNSQQAKAMRTKVGINCMSFMQYQDKLAQNGSANADGKQLLVIVNAEQIGTLLLDKIVTQARETKTRGLLVFNPYTTQGFSAGAPLLLLSEKDLPQIQLTEPFLSFAPAHRGALTAIEKNQLGQALAELTPMLQVFSGSETRLEHMVRDYCQSLSGKAQPLVLAGYKEEAEGLNQAIRAELKSLGRIKPSGISATVLIPKPMSLLQMKSVRYYHPGDWISFDRTLYSQGININTYAKVIKVDHQKNIITAETEKGKVLCWNPAQLPSFTTTVHLAQTREFVIGDRVSCLKAPRYSLIPQDKILTVTKARKSSITLTAKGFRQTVNLNKLAYSHFDYGYAQSKQLLPEHSKLLCHLPSTLAKADKRQFYRLISNAKGLVLYTDNQEKLVQALQKSSGDKTNLKSFKARCFADKPCQDKTTITQKAIDYATHHLIEREAAFHFDELFEHSAHFALGDINVPGFESEHMQRVQNKQLLQGANRYRNQLTTEPMHSLEQLIVVSALYAPKVTSLAKAVDAELLKVTDEHTLVPEQKAAFENILSSRAPIRALQGYPGTGKSTLLRALSHYCNSHKIDMIALAPTITAANNLKDEKAGLHAQTLDSFLVELAQDERAISKDSLIILDEASMVSNQKLFALQSVVLKHQGHLLYAGDERQLLAIDAGKPFVMLQLAGLPTDYLSEIKRQQTQVLKQAVHEVALEQYQQAFATLRNNILEISDEKQEQEIKNGKFERLAAMAKIYTKLSPQEREQWLLITPRNEDRRKTNSLIRERLIKQSELSGETLEVPHLIPKNLSYAQTTFIYNYQVGDVLRFTRSLADVGVRRDHYAKVIEVSEKTQQLRLKLLHQDKEVIVSPANLQAKALTHAATKDAKPKTINSKQRLRPFVEVYEQQPIELSKGDKIRATRTDRSCNRITGDVGTIIKINHQQQLAVIKMDNGTIQTRALNEPKNSHYTHAYTSTTHTAQGGSYQHVVYLCESKQKYLTNQRSFWVGLSRAVQTVTLVTDNKSKLLEQIEQTAGAKFSAMEILQTARNVESVREKQQAQLLKQQDAMSKQSEHQRNLAAKQLAMQQSQQMLKAMKKTQQRQQERER